MPFSAGPNIAARPNLVFEYDTGDVKNSYIGEPTTNLAPYSQDFSQWGGNLFGNWINSNVTLNNGYAPDGTFTANTFGNGYSRFTNSIAASTNTIYTFSVWLQNVSLTGAGVQLWYAFGLNGGLVSYANGLSVGVGTLTNQWQRFQFSVTSPSSGINQLQFGVAPFTGYGNNNSGQLVNVWGGQVEQKNHATQYLPTTTTIATRSNTQGLLDVSGYGNILDLSTTSYDSNAQLVFDGTDDKIIGSTVVLPTANNSPMTLEAVAKTNNASGWQTVLGTSLSLRQIGFLNNNFYFGGNGGGGNSFVSGGTITAGQLYHIVMVYNGTTGYGYKNGVLVNSGNIGSNGNNNGVPLISTYTTGGGGEFLNGSVPIARVYNSALSAQEVLRNYNQLKGRFNLP
jgi:hypothetical protein